MSRKRERATGITRYETATPQRYVPKLRFPEFRSAAGWGSSFGNKVFDQINNKNHNSDIPVLAITQEHGAIPRDLIAYHVFVTEKSIENYKVVEVGDFIISLRSFQGGIEYSRYNGICSPAYVILRLKSGYSSDYFRHFLKTDRFIGLLTKNIEGLRDGKIVNYTQFSELQLPIPCKKEQQKIADCLSSFDELITLQTKKLDAFKVHKKGLLQQLFPHEGEIVPRLRFPEFADAPVWEQRKVGEFYNFKNGLNKGKEFFGKGTPIVNFTDVFHNRGLYSSQLTGKVELSEKEIKNFEVKQGDIFFTRTSETIEEIGYPSVMLDTPKSTVFSGFVLRGRAIKDDPLTNIFKRYVFFTTCFRAEMQRKSSITTRALTSGTSIKEMYFNFPASKDEQTKIGSFFAALDRLITLHQRKLANLQNMKKGLLQQLFPSLNEAQQ